MTSGRLQSSSGTVWHMGDDLQSRLVLGDVRIWTRRVRRAIPSRPCPPNVGYASLDAPLDVCAFSMPSAHVVRCLPVSPTQGLSS